MSLQNKVPTMGNIIVEAVIVKFDEFIKEKMEAKDKCDADFLSKFEIVRADTDAQGQMIMKLDSNAPINCGKVLKLAVDSFGAPYEHHFGEEATVFMRENIKIGTLVYFVPNQSYKIDAAGRYHMINDHHVQMFEHEVIMNTKSELTKEEVTNE